MKIATKLYLLVGLLLALSVSVGGMGLFGMKTAVGGLETVYNDRVVPLRDLKDIADAYAVNIVGIAHQVRDGELSANEGLAKVESAEKLIAAKRQSLKDVRMNEAEKQAADELDKRVLAANATVARLKQLLSDMRVADIPQFVAYEMKTTIEPVSDLLSRLITLQLDAARQEYEASAATYSRIRIVVIALVVAGLLAGFGVAAWTIRGSVQRPLALTQEVAREIAAGNLTVSIPDDRRDEMGLLLKSLAGMRDGLRKTVTELKANAEGVAAAAAQLSATSTQVAGATAHQAEAASSMAAAVEEMTVSINHVSDSAREAHSITAETGNQSQAGSRIIEDTVAEMKRISQTVGEAAGTIAAMGESSQRISGIVQVIKDVAEQTNLLALNAAIEAARAGEQGRGFAVVADEVRKLAERTAQATTEIGGMIVEVQSSAQAAVGTMQQAVTRVEDGVGLAQKASDSMLGISGGAQRVVASVNEISDALKEQSVASNDIAANVEKIAQMSEENSAASREAAETAHHLEQLAASTRAAVSVFRV